MSNQTNDEAFAARVRIFAKVAIIVAFVALAFSIVKNLIWAGTSAGAALGHWLPGERWRVVRMVAAFLREVFRSCPQAFVVMGTAIVALLAPRLVMREVRPSWAPVLPKDFDRKAALFALITQLVAWVFLLLAGGAIVTGSYRIVTAESDYWSAVSAVKPAINGLLYGAQRFFILLLGAHVVQALLLVSRKQAAPAPLETGGQSHE